MSDPTTERHPRIQVYARGYTGKNPRELEKLRHRQYLATALQGAINQRWSEGRRGAVTTRQLMDEAGISSGDRSEVDLLIIAAGGSSSAITL